MRELLIQPKPKKKKWKGKKPPRLIMIENSQKRKDDTGFARIATNIKFGSNKTNRKKEYRKYLRSEEWKAKKKKLIDRWQCGVCGHKKRKHLNVHHRTYKNVFYENKEDLMVLCGRCHELWHFTPRPTIRKIQDIVRADKIEKELNERLDFHLE